MLNLLKKHREIIAYVICGAATTLVSLITYYLCAQFIFNTDIALQLQAANVISWVISVLFAFVTNKLIVFKSKESPQKEIVKFYAARVATLLVDMGLMYLLVSLCRFDDMIIKCVVQIIVIVLNYVFGKTLVFVKK